MIGAIPKRDNNNQSTSTSWLLGDSVEEVKLLRFRRRGDPLADNVAASLNKTDGGLMGIHDLLGQVQDRASKISESVTTVEEAAANAACAAFMKEVEENPTLG